MSSWGEYKFYDSEKWVESPANAQAMTSVQSGGTMHLEGPNGSMYAIPNPNEPVVFKTATLHDVSPWSFTLAVGKPVEKARFEPRFPLNVSRAELLAFIRGLNWSVTCPVDGLEGRIPNKDVRKFLVRQNESTMVSGIDMATVEDKSTEEELAKMFEDAQNAEVVAQAADKAEHMLEEIAAGINIVSQPLAFAPTYSYKKENGWEPMQKITWDGATVMADGQLNKLVL